tara:strand:+ start:9 stop:1268 length:1260 start_codon:yes stop_codon:yes gene_type:complete
MSGAGASATGESASISVGGSNHNADISNGNNYGANLNLYNYNSTDGNSSAVSFMNSNGLSASRVVGNNASHSSRTGNLVFMTASGSSPVEKMRITSDGFIGMGGNTNPTNVLHIKTAATNTAVATIESTATNSYPFLRLKNDAREYQLTCHGGLADAFTIYDGTSSAHRFMINSSGQVMIGTDTPSSNQAAQALTIALQNSGNTGITLRSGTGGGDTNEASIFFSDATSGAGEYAGYLQYSHANEYFRIGVESEEMLRLNNTSVQGTPAMQLRKPNAASNVQSHMIHLIVGGHDRGALIAASSFGGSAIVGAISDYRVKTNIRDYTGGWDNIKALPVKIFDISKEGEEATDIKGWIAHEVQAVIPEAVTGTKDAKKEDGSDDLQSLGYNVFMPDVVSALQTAMTKIETLEAEVAALKSN